MNELVGSQPLNQLSTPGLGCRLASLWHQRGSEVGAEEIGTLAGFGGNLFCIEQDEPAEGLLANGAEVGMLVGAHATVFLRTPDAFAEVAAALDE